MACNSCATMPVGRRTRPPEAAEPIRAIADWSDKKRLTGCPPLPCLSYVALTDTPSNSVPSRVSCRYTHAEVLLQRHDTPLNIDQCSCPRTPLFPGGKYWLQRVFLTESDRPPSGAVNVRTNLLPPSPCTLDIHPVLVGICVVDRG